MKNWAKIIFVAICVFGTCFGMFVISPAFNVSIDSGAGIGTFLGLLLAFLTPNLMNALAQKVTEENMDALKENRQLNLVGYFIHPTELPNLLGTIWLIGFVAIAILFRIDTDNNKNLYWLIPGVFLFGVSGLIKVLRNEYIKSNFLGGFEIVRGGWAKFFGFTVMIFFWGICVSIILEVIFD
jgi:hypothetical protein